MRLTFARKKWSMSTSATIASPIGTKRGSKHGSFRPFTRMSVDSPVRVTVRCERGILLVGWIATRHTIGIPLEMPPSIPPCRFEAVVIGEVASNTSLPRVARMFATAKPAPYSKPNTAGSESNALPRSAFSLSKIGSPKTWRHTRCDQLAHAADGVAVFPHFVDE